MTDGFVVAYRGGLIEFKKIDTGYAYMCPAGCCRAWHHIDTASGTRHKITSAEGEPVTIVASLACPCTKKDGTKCTWHVFVTDGEARDT